MKAMFLRARATLAVPVASFVIALASPLTAMAQQFEKVEGKVTEDIPAVPFVALAYGFIWIAVLGYLVYVARSLGRVSAEVAELRRKLDVPQGTRPGAAPGPAGRKGS
jgi:CcmD family protein